MTCALCNDTGWKYIGPDNDRRVTRCNCRDTVRAERLLKLARIPRRYKHCELSNFDVLPGRFQAAMQGAKLAAEKFVENYPVERDGILFLGPVGVGKTHLAVGIMQELIRSKGVPCLFYDYRELLKEIQNSYNSSVQTTEMEVLRPVMEAEIVVLDELGAVKPSEWVWDTVSLVLNTRYNENRTTIITSNLADLPPREAAGDDSRSASAARRASSESTLGDRITERMRSRLHEMCRKIEMNGEDFRQKFKMATFNSL
jgi:DNA replication protein DnaC